LSFDAIRELEREWSNHYNVKKIDVGAMHDLFKVASRQEAIASIDAEWRRRRRAKIWADIPTPRWKHAGQQSLVDIPTDVPLEKFMLDEMGVHHKYGDPWRCKKCGTKFETGFPPDYCPVCKMPSFIVKKEINLRR